MVTGYGMSTSTLSYMGPCAKVKDAERQPNTITTLLILIMLSPCSPSPEPRKLLPFCTAGNSFRFVLYMPGSISIDSGLTELSVQLPFHNGRASWYSDFHAGQDLTQTIHKASHCGRVGGRVGGTGNRPDQWRVRHWGSHPRARQDRATCLDRMSRRLAHRIGA